MYLYCRPWLKAVWSHAALTEGGPASFHSRLTRRKMSHTSYMRLLCCVKHRSMQSNHHTSLSKASSKQPNERKSITSNANLHHLAPTLDTKGSRHSRKQVRGGEKSTRKTNQNIFSNFNQSSVKKQPRKTHRVTWCHADS